jgi:hypothetical protein
MISSVSAWLTRQAGLQRGQLGGAGIALFCDSDGIEAQQEAVDQFLDQAGAHAQGLGHVAGRELAAGLAPVADVGAHQLHFAQRQAAFDGQAVQAAVFGFVVEQRANSSSATSAMPGLASLAALSASTIRLVT